MQSQKSRGFREADNHMGILDWVTDLNDAIEEVVRKKWCVQVGEGHSGVEFCNDRRGRRDGSSCTYGVQLNLTANQSNMQGRQHTRTQKKNGGLQTA
jgi:hypothetical protein